ncbi:Calcineurin-binding protein cabin-1, variant 2 [Chamberlinius hualienensis]
MIKIAALNDESASGQSKASYVEVTTKEAQEEAAFALYNQGLEFLNENKLDEADEAFREIVKIHTVSVGESNNNCKDEGKHTNSPGLLLVYSAYKNLANIAIKRRDFVSAMEAYLEAVTLDSSDVSLWFRIGTTSLTLHRYSLASLAFQEALKCNPNHKPSLDNIITVLFVLNDYTSCLYHIGQVLQRDSANVKALAIRDQIFREDPGLRKSTNEYFAECDDDIYTTSYDTEVGQSYINEALEMRIIKKKKSTPTAPPVLHFVKPLSERKSWKVLGESLVDLYNLIRNASKPISFSCRLNLAKYLTSKENEDKPKSSNDDKLEACASNDDKEIQTKTADCDSEKTVEIIVSAKELKSDVIDSEVPVDPGEPQSLSDQNGNHDSNNAKKNRKRKSFPFEFIDASSKRRSTRVRNTLTKKEPDHINFAELLQQFLPSSLLRTSNNDGNADTNTDTDECDTGNTNSITGRADVESEFKPALYGERSEEEDVLNFLKSCLSNTGVLDVLYRYLMNLIDHRNRLWPSGLTDIYIEAYTKVRQHITHPSLLCQDRENGEIKDEGIMTLLYCEFKLDKCLSTKMEKSGEAKDNLGITSCSYSVENINDHHFSIDLEFLNYLSLRMDILEDMYLEFCIRVLWLRARYYILIGQTDFAVDCFERIEELLKQLTNERTIFLVNCILDNEISKEHITKQLQSLQQSKSFEDLNVLFTAGKFQSVVDLLVPTLTPKVSNEIIGSTKKLHDRQFQLLLLQEALCLAGDRQQWLLYGEASLYEVWQINSSSSNNQLKQLLSNSVTEILIKLQVCVSKEASIVHTLPPAKLKRLITTLVQIIVQKMETPNHVAEMPFKTNAPWIILYSIIQQEEEKIKSLMVKVVPCENASDFHQHDSDNCSDSEFGPGMPSSLMLLYSAHEYLGRRGWCCASDGSLLLFYSNVLSQELKKYSVNNPHPYKEDLEMSIEQCFFCLYGHPNKKTKAKYLQEHGAPKITLTWDRAVSVFDYFKPKELPSFDSVKTVSISAELENLLRRIYSLILPEDDISSTLEVMRSFIDGDIDEMPVYSDKKEKPIIKELYYLLADYYFKNNEQGKAIKFFLLDLCINQDRIDSWAGLALSKGSQLQQRLNSCDIKLDGSIYQKAAPVLKCFHKALLLDPAAANLWIEYGSVAYMLQSYTSRCLKQQTNLGSAAEVTQMLNTKRVEMLNLSKLCFESAIECDNAVEEEWLLHFMLGKIAEKTARPIKEYLNHYKLAAKHLYMEGARYPKKIQYHSPQNLSLEALEVYYRIHSVIMKFLLKRESTILDTQTYEILESYLNDAAEGHFINFQEKRYRNDSQTTSDCDDSALPEECLKNKRINPLVSDHDYFKRKRKNLGPESSSAENRQKLMNESSNEREIQDVINSLVTSVCEEFTITDVTKSVSNALQIETDTKSKIDVTSTASPNKSSTKTSGTSGKDTVGHRALILRCEEALRQCLQRFPQHYKSLFRLANYFYASRFRKNVQWSWDYLLGPQGTWQQTAHMCSPALFAERKNTNFFNGIWRIPNDEIDRAGSFASHMYRSILLVIDVLVETGDHNLLVHLAIQLHRNPDAGKKYLRDIERLQLAKRACEESVNLLLKKMRQLCREESSLINQTRIVHHLLLVFRAWQNFQKVVTDQEITNDMLIKAFCIYRRGQVTKTVFMLNKRVHLLIAF